VQNSTQKFSRVGANYKGNFGFTADSPLSVTSEKYASDLRNLLGADNTTISEDGKTVALISQSPLAAGNDKAYQDHTIYAGFTFKALQEAKIGTTIDAEVGFYTEKASQLKNGNVQTTAFLFGAGAGLNFRNGIKDDVHVLVGYVKKGSDTAKVLPFAITNVLSYTVDSDATFSFKLTYAQNALKEKKSVQGTANTNAGYYTNNALANGTPLNAKDADGKDVLANYTKPVSGDYGWLIGAAPSFSWNIGASKFSMGVSAVTLGDIVNHAKSGHEWSWTGLRGRKAIVSFPLSWTYTF